MKEYIGERVVGVAGTPFEHFDTVRWIRYFVDRFGNIAGSHHKHRVLDDVMRLTFGAPVEIKLAEWAEAGTVVESEYRVSVGTSPEYTAWLAEREADGYPWSRDED